MECYDIAPSCQIDITNKCGFSILFPFTATKENGVSPSHYLHGPHFVRFSSCFMDDIQNADIFKWFLRNIFFYFRLKAKNKGVFPSGRGFYSGKSAIISTFAPFLFCSCCMFSFSLWFTVSVMSNFWHNIASTCICRMNLYRL